MIKLSVNVNKIAWLRNARGGNTPDLARAARTIIDAGAHGITVHPRPDQRHITAEDTRLLARLLHDYPAIEYNIEGNPGTRSRKNGFPGFDALIEECEPDQCTLVPDGDGQLTSDHGFDLLSGSNSTLKRRIRKFQGAGARVSLFMDPEVAQIRAAADCGADRVELYTGPFADAYAEHGENSSATQREFARYVEAAETVAELGLGLNAGHDLNTQNLPLFRTVRDLKEVSIGHALISEALDTGLTNTVRNYLRALGST